MRRFLFLLTMALCTGTAIFSQTDRNTRYVAVQTAVLKSSTGFFAKEVGKLPLGTAVTLVRDNGKWSEVRAGSLAGWVVSSSLSARRVIASNSPVTASEIALAGKGFSPDVEIEYRKNGLDYRAVDSMESLTIPPEELLKFINEGHLSKGE
jgi:SH3-like domain-containing protein